MSSNAVKLYVWLHLSACFSGSKRGCVEASFDDIARALGWTSKTLQRTIEELERRPYVRVERAANQYELTTIRILRYDRHSNSGVDKFDHSNSDAVDSAVDNGVDKFDHGGVHSNPPMPLEDQSLRASKNAVEVKKEKKELDAVRRRFDAELPVASSSLKAKPNPNPSSNGRAKLQARIARRIANADERFSSYIEACLKRGHPHPFGADEQDAFRAVGYKPDLSSDHLSFSFVMSVVNVYEEHRDKGVTPGNLCSKVIDYCTTNRKKDITLGGNGDGYYWPPDFQQHRDRLRRQERQEESVLPSKRETPEIERIRPPSGISEENMR